jgi:hypothetical protein
VILFNRALPPAFILASLFSLRSRACRAARASGVSSAAGPALGGGEVAGESAMLIESNPISEIGYALSTDLHRSLFAKSVVDCTDTTTAGSFAIARLAATLLRGTARNEADASQYHPHIQQKCSINLTLA